MKKYFIHYGYAPSPHSEPIGNYGVILDFDYNRLSIEYVRAEVKRYCNDKFPERIVDHVVVFDMKPL